jgi:parallel beta-helix repeat protein
MKKLALALILLMVFCSVLISFPRISLVKASPGVIYIRANGAIDPPTANITSLDNVTYTFNDNIFNCSIVVERNNIIIDGANKTLQGTGSGAGMNVTGISNVTVRNLEIKEFDWGIYLWSSSNITVTENRIVNNTSVGIYLRYTLNSNLTENIIMDNNYEGILLFQLNNNTRIIRNNMTNNGEYGITLMYSSNYSLISENNIRGHMWDGVGLYDSYYNTIVGNNITENNLGTGISIWDSSNNEVSGNNVTNTYNGISLFRASNNTVYRNAVTNSSYIGFTLYNSYNNSLSENTIRNSTYNFDVWGDDFSHFMNLIDTSNLVNDKPIYYYVNETDLVINPVTHPQIGYLAIINSVNVTVEHQTLRDNAEGILLAYSNASEIRSNNIIANEYGVVFVSSCNNTLFGNNITANNDHGVHLKVESSNNMIFGNNMAGNPYYGIELDDSFNNTIFENKIADSEYGIYLYDSSNNILYGNWIADNEYGLYLDSYYPNSFYHNNFVNNLQHMYLASSGYANFWDNGFEGNYWSNYTGVDLNHDGIGDAPHVLDADNQDNYPLMGLFNSFNTSLGYKVNVISNSTIDSFEYFESNTTIKMYVSNITTTQEYGFCRIAIPHTLMNVSTISVIIDNGLTPLLYNNYTVYDNGTHRWIYFAYEHSTHEINIIPEFPFLIILTSLTMATLILIFCKRKRLTHHFSTFKE